MDNHSESEKEKRSVWKRLFHKEDTADHVEKEILSMVSEGNETGALEPNEALMIHNIVGFADKEAADICTKRNDIQAIDKNTGILEALQFMLESSFSRYPVYDDNIDHIIGILYLKDTARVHARYEDNDLPIDQVPGLIRNAMFVPETMNIDDLFRKMQMKKTQLSVVVDEYGQTTGIVSMEDILEEIVGNIFDEYDVEEHHIRKRRGKPDEYVIDGCTPIEEIENKLGIRIEEGPYETLNGFMISRLDRLPEKNESFVTECDGYSFEILSVENRMILKVSVKKIPKKEEEQQ